MLFPDIKPPRDHIDGNGLNNTKSNVRCGSFGINNRNQVHARNKGISGVTVLEHRKRTKAVWQEADGRVVEKIFTWSKFESKEAAYREAVKCRTENNQRVIKELLDNPPTCKNSRKTNGTPVSNTGIKNVMYNPSASRIQAEVVIDKKRFYKNFKLVDYAGSKDAATEAGRAWVEQIRSENPSQKKKQKVAE